jgi:hypothetical protein
MNIRQQTLLALKSKYQADIQQHEINIEVMLANPMAIEDHSNFVGAVDKHIESIADLQDRIEVIERLL